MEGVKFEDAWTNQNIVYRTMTTENGFILGRVALLNNRWILNSLEIRAVDKDAEKLEQGFANGFQKSNGFQHQ